MSSTDREIAQSSTAQFVDKKVSQPPAVETPGSVGYFDMPGVSQPQVQKKSTFDLRHLTQAAFRPDMDLYEGVKCASPIIYDNQTCQILDQGQGTMVHNFQGTKKSTPAAKVIETKVDPEAQLCGGISLKRITNEKHEDVYEVDPDRFFEV